MKFQIQILEAERGGTFVPPDGCDGYPHHVHTHYVAGRGFVLVVVWRRGT